ncbi:MAG: hypothetical protein AAFR22_17595, partial [Chloroflexota bacterium]
DDGTHKTSKTDNGSPGIIVCRRGCIAATHIFHCLLVSVNGSTILSITLLLLPLLLLQVLW